MGIRSILSKPIASIIVSRQNSWANRPGNSQERQFNQLISSAKDTLFGRDHDFSGIREYEDFKSRVPVRDYEDISHYIRKILEGGKDILWPGKPVYFAKTSGTTSGTKYIPITRESVPNHIHGARDALLNYIHETGNSSFLDGNLIFLSGSPVLHETAGIKTGRLSGIVNHHVPAYLRSNQVPSYETNCIEDWEMKVERVIDETLGKRMTLISGIPPWVQMYFDRIIQRTGKKIAEVFPDFSLFVYGGVNFEPYKAKLYESIGKKIDSIETYPASEGFIAFQDRQDDPGLLLLLNSGIFFEFIPASEYSGENPSRLKIDEVEVGVNYALIINSNAGLWGYTIEDTVKFISKDPYRLIVTGRIKHFISAFGEHVIGEEVEKAMQYAMRKHPEVELVEFTVAPQVTPREGLPLHEWYMEFGREPEDMETFEKIIDEELQKLNSYYFDLVSGAILHPLKIRKLSGGAFRDYMKSYGKLGGQNKVPRLANDRTIADFLEKYVIH
ncbi:MAG: GH3 auxin-responsive promoter family protein [Cyclobacteriaceae bacterium]|nr:GH3 auxin-responsive promoter family protein [Cyclobacteriaceae bacterium]